MDVGMTSAGNKFKSMLKAAILLPVYLLRQLSPLSEHHSDFLISPDLGTKAFVSWGPARVISTVD
jgi:hypothetical protein